MSRLFRAAGSISAITLLSRILGLLRDSLMMQMLGARWVQGVFLLAWTLPNLMRRLLGEGALSASLVPAYAKLRQHDEPAAKRLLDDVFGALLTILTPLCALVTTFSLLAPADWFPVPEDGGVESIRLLLALNAVLFIYALPVCLSAVSAGALNTLGSFALPAAIPVALNIIWIAALVAAKPLGLTVDTEVATLVSWSLMIGGFIQLLMVTVPLWRRGKMGRPRFSLPKRNTAAFGVFVAMGPTLLGMSLNQISSILDQVLAFALIAPGANSYVYLANRLLLFPHALTAMSVGVAVFPQLASEAEDKDSNGGNQKLRKTLNSAASATILVTLPAAAGLILLSGEIVSVLFEGGEFLASDVTPTVRTTACLVIGLPFLGLTQLYARAFYAVGDTATPARLAIWLVPFNFALSVTMMLTTSLGTAALTLSSSITTLANASCLAIKFRRHAPAASGRAMYLAWARSALATLAMCAVVPLCHIASSDDTKLVRAMGNLVLPIIAGIAACVLTHVLLRSPELRALARLDREQPDK